MRFVFVILCLVIGHSALAADKLISAVQTENLDLVKAVYERNRNKNLDYWYDDETPLLVAAKLCNREITEFFLGEGATPELHRLQRNSDRNSYHVLAAFTTAIERDCSEEFVKTVLPTDFSSFYETSRFKVNLDVFLMKNSRDLSTEFFQVAIERGLKLVFEEQVLAYAVKGRKLELFDLFLAQGADLNESIARFIISDPGLTEDQFSQYWDRVLEFDLDWTSSGKCRPLDEYTRWGNLLECFVGLNSSRDLTWFHRITNNAEFEYRAAIPFRTCSAIWFGDRFKKVLDDKLVKITKHPSEIFQSLIESAYIGFYNNAKCEDRTNILRSLLAKYPNISLNKVVVTDKKERRKVTISPASYFLEKVGVNHYTNVLLDFGVPKSTLWPVFVGNRKLTDWALENEYVSLNDDFFEVALKSRKLTVSYFDWLLKNGLKIDSTERIKELLRQFFRNKSQHLGYFPKSLIRNTAFKDFDPNVITSISSGQWSVSEEVFVDLLKRLKYLGVSFKEFELKDYCYRENVVAYTKRQGAKTDHLGLHCVVRLEPEQFFSMVDKRLIKLSHVKDCSNVFKRVLIPGSSFRRITVRNIEDYLAGFSRRGVDFNQKICGRKVVDEFFEVRSEPKFIDSVGYFLNSYGSWDFNGFEYQEAIAKFLYYSRGVSEENLLRMIKRPGAQLNSVYIENRGRNNWSRRGRMSLVSYAIEEGQWDVLGYLTENKVDVESDPVSYYSDRELYWDRNAVTQMVRMYPDQAEEWLLKWQERGLLTRYSYKALEERRSDTTFLHFFKKLPRRLFAVMPPTKRDLNEVGGGSHPTLLIGKVRENDLSEAEYLIQLGADINHPGVRGRRTPLDVALDEGYIKMAEMLLKYGAKSYKDL